MDFDKLVNKYFKLLNELTNKESYLTTVKTTRLSNELLETLKTIDNCTNCKKKIRKFHGLIKGIETRIRNLYYKENLLYENVYGSNRHNDLLKLFDVGDELNKRICESCKEKEIEKLTDKCGNEEMARFLYQCKMNANNYYHHCSDYIRWIPFHEFRNIEHLAKGSFSEVHKATWFGFYNYFQKKYDDVVLKRIYNSGDKIIDVLKELKANDEIKVDINRCHGITRSPKDNDYLLVFEYAKNGDLHNNLSKNFKEITWSDKIGSLYLISRGLKEIHERNYIHYNLHSGNIFSYRNDFSLIGDLGLCRQLKENDGKSEIFGVVSYSAPEVLSGEPYTKKSDIYSFGMIMWEFTTGKQPFHDKPHDNCLMLDIVEGERPEIIAEDIPEFYADLMKKCWDPNPENRPTAGEILDHLKKNRFSEEIGLAESKRQEIIKLEKHLIEEKDNRDHPESSYASSSSSKLIQKGDSLSFHRMNKMIHASNK